MKQISIIRTQVLPVYQNKENNYSESTVVIHDRNEHVYLTSYKNPSVSNSIRKIETLQYQSYIRHTFLAK